MQSSTRFVFLRKILLRRRKCNIHVSIHPFSYLLCTSKVLWQSAGAGDLYVLLVIQKSKVQSSHGLQGVDKSERSSSTGI